jgi:hypothetical protein
VKEEVYRKYAEEHVKSTQIDDVLQDSLLG